MQDSLRSLWRFAGLVVATGIVAQATVAAAPARAAKPMAKPGPAVTQGNRQVITATGRIEGKVTVSPDPGGSSTAMLIGDSNCPDLVVSAWHNGADVASARATGTYPTQQCSFTLEKLVGGDYVLRFHLKGKGLPPQVLTSKKVQVTANGTTKPQLVVKWPVQPTGVVQGGVQGGGVCNGVKVTVAHAIKTFETTTGNYVGPCQFHLEVPEGPVTVSIAAPSGFAVAPKTGTVDPTKALIADFVMAAAGSITLRLHAADYPASIPNLDCSPWKARVLAGTVLLLDRQLYGGEVNDRECSDQLSNLPSGTPLTLEITKAGTVVHSETVEVTANQDVAKVVVALP